MRGYTVCVLYSIFLFESGIHFIINCDGRLHLWCGWKWDNELLSPSNCRDGCDLKLFFVFLYANLYGDISYGLCLQRIAII